MQPKLLLFSTFLLFAITASSQKTIRKYDKCGSIINVAEILRDPRRARTYIQNENKIQQKIKDIHSSSITGVDLSGEIKIPVVFHIIAPDPNVITDAMINQQLAVLNRDYSGSNEDSINASWFYNIRGHSKIKFELAKRSPRGCDTTGITRTISNLSVHSNVFDDNDNLISASTISQAKHKSTGGSDAWESYNCKYLNIWVCPLTNDLLGIATFPDSDVPPNEQGVVVDKSSFSFTYPGDYIYGRTLVHEVGHFLNLRHIWGDDGKAANKCSGTDGVDDTPNQEVATYGRPVVPLFDACSPNGTTSGFNYQNFMDYCDDTVLTMFTKGQIDRIIASLAAFPNRMNLIDKKNKALVPKEDNQLFNQCNTAAFATNNFTCVGVGKYGVLWAGSSDAGLYNYYGGTWHQYGAYTKNLYWDIEADKDGGIWVAQSGYNSAQAQTGGVLYFPDSLSNANFYSASNGLPSRYARSIFIDTSSINVGQGGTINPLVWTAHLANVTAGTSSNGGVGRGFDPVSPNFTTIREGLEPGNIFGGTASCYVIAGTSSEIVAATQSNYQMSQLLRYNAITNTLIGTYDTTNALAGFGLGPNFTTRSVYFDKIGRLWVAINNAGLMVLDTNKVWKKISYPKIFPSSIFFNNNALSGDADGNVYVGTNAGLIVYSGGQSLAKDSAFSLYTVTNGLPSNNIKAIAVDTVRQKLVLATDAGVMLWNPVCAGGPAVDNTTFSTVSSGDWNNPSTWCGGVVPPLGAKIIVRNPITITADVKCKSLQLVLPGSFTVSTGVNLIIGD